MSAASKTPKKKKKKEPLVLNVVHPPTQDPDCIVIMSNGMGVESQAIFERWCAEPETRPFRDWSQLIIVTSQVGEEHKHDTIKHMTERTLPMIRERGIRFVELARRGPLEEDGIVVLQDTRQPVELHPDGVYKLSDELLRSGTVPQFGGEHRCAMKFKAFVIEAWLSYEFQFNHREAPIYHVFGYNAEERSRIGKSDEAILLHNGERQQERPNKAPLMVFGFNDEEGIRVARSKEYDGPHRTGTYPLLEWAWGRQKCLDYIFEKSGIHWKKSHCAGCPFCKEASKGEPDAVQRWRDAPEETAHWLNVEFNSMCMNPRGQLYRDTSLREQVTKAGVKEALDAAARVLSSIQWGVYRVRRVYTAKGKAFRAVERIKVGKHEEMQMEIHSMAYRIGNLDIQVQNGIAYAYFIRRTEDVYPSREGFYVAAPCYMDTKLRGELEMFEFRWNHMSEHGRLPTKVEEKPLQKELKKRAKERAKEAA
jgi:hypothetical protein